MATTNHIGVTLLEQSQSQKEVTMNQALSHIDALMNTGAKSRTTSTPPGSPSAGDVYIVGGSSAGDWAGNAGDITYYDQLWRFITPREGMTLWVEDESQFATYDGSAWQALLVSNGTSYTQSLWVPAAQMRPSVTSGCAALAQTEISAGQPDIHTLDFDASNEEYAQFTVSLREGWNEGAITAAFYWSHAAAASNYDVVWALDAVAISTDDAVGTAFGTAQQVSDTGGTSDDLYITSQTAALTIAGSPAAGDLCFFRASRKAADGGDTLAADARLHGIKLFYTVNNYADV